MIKPSILVASLCFLTAGNGFPAVSPEFAEALEAVRAVGPEGAGNASAARGWRILTGGGPDTILPLLEGMTAANELAVNWLRSAVETVAAREGRDRLPLAELGQFLLETRHHPRARRLALELIAQVDAANAQKLLPGLLNDPGSELRRDAVQQLIDNAGETFKAGNKSGALLLYQQALVFARDAAQTDLVAKKLKELGQTVDLAKHFAFLMSWKIIGPFDNTGGKGFNTVFPPETAIELDATYSGKTNQVRWQNYTSTHHHGKVDLNKPCGTLKGVTGYAYTEFRSDQSQAAELRLASKNGWKIWFNGQYILGRDEYHRMTELDQYRFPVVLQKGVNRVLVKVCQDELVEAWTKEWEFQLRVTDALGTPVTLVAAGFPDGAGATLTK